MQDGSKGQDTSKNQETQKNSDALKGNGSHKKSSASDSSAYPVRKANVVDVASTIEPVDDLEIRNTLWKKEAQAANNLKHSLTNSSATNSSAADKNTSATIASDRTSAERLAEQLAEQQARMDRDPSPVIDPPTVSDTIDALDSNALHPISRDQSEPDPTLFDRTDSVLGFEHDTEAAAEDRHIPYAASSQAAASDSPSLRTPLLAIAATVGLLAAAWSYTALEETRAQLTVVTEAKASVDRQLADAQSRLSAAETAVANVKAALTSVPAKKPASGEAAKASGDAAKASAAP